MIFSCPPYGDLERYSDDPRDLSAQDHEAFLRNYRTIVAASVALLADDRFAVFVVGDFRDERGLYRNFVAETIRAFHDAGAHLYNDAVLVTAVGSLPIRVRKQFTGNRKLGRTHQNVLVFWKGDPSHVRDALGDFDLTAVEEDRAGTVEPDAPPDRVPPELSPVERRGDLWLKREDLFRLGEATGGKARTIAVLAAGASGLVACGSRQSTQVSRAAQVAQALGLPCRIHTAEGAETDGIVAAEQAGAEVLRHSPGRLSVLKARARADAAERSWVEVPWGMECREALEEVAAQCANLPPEAERVVVVVGSGMTLAGILLGLSRLGRQTPVLGVCVGGDPEARLTRWSPGWRDRAELVRSDLAYEDEAPSTDLHGVELDPVYEAKAAPHLRPGDLFWIVGIRAKPRPN